MKKKPSKMAPQPPALPSGKKVKKPVTIAVAVKMGGKKKSGKKC